MAGRQRMPHEKPVWKEYRNLPGFISSLQRATITDLDSTNGTCTIEFEATPGERPGVNLPLYMHLGTPGNRRKANWKRHMPCIGDTVVVGFDSNAAVRIIGYDYIDYTVAAEIQATEKYGFVDLVEGEFDERSSGGAYIKGDANGNLLLAGGMSSIWCDKRRGEIRYRAPLLKDEAGLCTFRRGAVRRSSVPFTQENAVKAGKGAMPLMTPVDAALQDLVEWTADLRAPTQGTPVPGKVGFFSLGNVMDPDLSTAVGDAYVGPLGIKKFVAYPLANARLFLRIYSSAPLLDTPNPADIGPLGGSLRPYEWGVDQLGNSFQNVGSTAVYGWNVWSSTGIGLFSNKLCLAGNVFLGGTPAPAGVNNTLVATQPAVCGALFNAALAACMDGLTTAATALATAAAAVTTGSAAEVVALSKALAATAGAISSATGTLAAAAVSTAWLSGSVYVAPPAPAGTGVIPPLSFYLL